VERAEAMAAYTRSLLEPLVNRLAEQEVIIRDQAETIGSLRERLAVAEAPKAPEPAPVPEPLMPALDGELTSRCESVFPTGGAAPWWRRWWGWGLL
jgi:hypothetical protein